MSQLLNITADFLETNQKRPLHAGDDYDMQFTAENLVPAGDAIDLTGAKVWFTIKADALDDDASALLSVNTVDDPTKITIDTPLDGIFTMHFKAADTAGLEGLFPYDIQIKLASGKLFTMARGNIEFLANLTRALT